jgi:putative restriction endonuclease
MPRLSKEALLGRILDSVRSAGWNFVYITDRHPYDLAIFRDERSFRVRVYVWNVTHGGGPVRAPTEYRIQITGVTLPLVAPQGYQTLLFGWYEDLGIVAAFDPERHRQPSAASPSIQISIDTLREASRQGFAVQRRGNQEIALAFRPELLVTYIESQRALHGFAGNSRDIQLLVQAGAGQEIPERQIRSLPAERERVVRMVSRRRREAGFRQRVLAAYHHSCAMCSLQMDLIEAAHIVPVGAPESTDETANGLALCALHHEAHDSSLVAVRPDYRVVVNENLIQTMRAAGRGGEEDRFRRELREVISLPVSGLDRPRPEYLQRALTLRGWQDA